MICMYSSASNGFQSYIACRPTVLLSCSRPDDFSVVMALGDSITAGLFARPSKIPDHDNYRNPRNQKPFQYLQDGSVQESQAQTLLPGFEEYRGKSYATGADLGAVTIPNVSISFLAKHSVKS